jgi:hypothetical protein
VKYCTPMGVIRSNKNSFVVVDDVAVERIVVCFQTYDMICVDFHDDKQIHCI